MPDDQILRTHLVNLLQSKGAHCDFETAVENFPPELRGQRPEGLPYSPWELLEHMRRAQADILEFCKNAAYEELDWPDDYWPESPQPPTPEDWDASVRQFLADLQAIETLVADETTSLHAEIPHGDGQTYLREALLVADHNAYHLGQFVTVRRLLGAWPPA